MTGEEIYTLMLHTGTTMYGAAFAVTYPTWDQAEQVAKDLYDAVAKLIPSPTAPGPIATDEWISSFDWEGQQRLYQRLYEIGHRIHK